MGFTLDVSISAVTVFLQGLLSFFSPCVLPLLPLYIGYLSGGTAVKGEDGKIHYKQSKVLVHTLFFVAGVSFAFFLLGLGVSAVGGFFHRAQKNTTREGIMEIRDIARIRFHWKPTSPSIDIRRYTELVYLSISAI